MKTDTAACVLSIFRDVADGKKVADKFGTMIQSAIRCGLTTKDDVANAMGVQPAHVFAKANALKCSEVRALCQKLAL